MSSRRCEAARHCTASCPLPRPLLRLATPPHPCLTSVASLHRLPRYVSCHAPSFVKNAVALCKPPSNALRNAPFYPVRAFPLDLFPHTEHCELVVLLERADPWPPKPPPRPDAGAPSSSTPAASEAASALPPAAAAAIAEVKAETLGSG